VASRRVFAFGALTALSVLCCGGRSSSRQVPAQDEPAPEVPEPPPVSEATEICSEREVAIEGHVDGERLSGKLDLGGQTIFTEGCFLMFFDGYRAMLHARGQGPLDRSGVVMPELGWLLFPGEDAEFGRWLCSDALSAELTMSTPENFSTRTAVAATSLHDLGRCPGEPVPGTIRLQWQGGGTPVSTVNGITFEKPLNPVTMGRPAMGLAEQTEACSLVYVRWDKEQPGGFVLTSPKDSDPGALYCIGAVTNLGTNSELELSAISRVGRCDEGRPAEGTVAACFD
jgi:hypothetical protein